MQQATIRPHQLIDALEETEIGLDYLLVLLKGVPFNEAAAIIKDARQLFLDWNLVLATLS